MNPFVGVVEAKVKDSAKDDEGRSEEKRLQARLSIVNCQIDPVPIRVFAVPDLTDMI